jgi:hypothetical protein
MRFSLYLEHSYGSHGNWSHGSITFSSKFPPPPPLPVFPPSHLAILLAGMLSLVVSSWRLALLGSRGLEGRVVSSVTPTIRAISFHGLSIVTVTERSHDTSTCKYWTFQIFDTIFFTRIMLTKYETPKCLIVFSNNWNGLSDWSKDDHIIIWMNRSHSETPVPLSVY